MDIDTFRWILADDGQALLAEAQACDLSDSARLATLSRLRRRAAPDRAAAAYEIARLRGRAAAKFARADVMYFTREALEQASGEVIAAYRARRYRSCATIADLACGIGGDALALARAAHVIALDRDPLRLAMAAANARAYGLDDRIAFVEADLTLADPPVADAIFFDPARRVDGRRVFTTDAYRPPLALVGRWRAATPAIGAKVAPGVSDDDLAALGELEAEFISVGGELKEAALWFGPLAEPGRRATILSGDGGSGAPPTLHAREIPPAAPVADPAAYLYEPDPAVIRAHLVSAVAVQIGAALLDPQIAYMTAPHATATPFARYWRVIEYLPFGLKRLRARLRALDAGAVTVKKRGSPLDADALARQLSGRGGRPLTVALTRAQGRPIALICEQPDPAG